MKNFKCNVGDNVVVIEEGELRNGVVKNIFDELNPPICVVEFETGIEKIPFNRVAPAPKKETQEEQKRGPVFKSEITITPDEFMKTAMSIIAEETKDFKITGLACSIIVAKIHKALFLDESK
jgi:hypothetical protein